MAVPTRLRRPLAALIAGLVLAGCPTPADPDAGTPEPPLYRVEGGAVVDAHGGALFLQGANVHQQAKWDPAHLVPLDEQDLTRLAEHGMGSVRLLTFWGAIEPEAGRYDEDYLARLAAEAEKLSSAGVYIVLDMHQDLWGEPFGDGAAGWACPEEVVAGYAPGDPWWVNYFSDQVSGCFDRLWGDDEVLEALAAAWQQAATAVCPYEGVVGFDLLNEPWPGRSLGERDFDQALLYQRTYRRLMQAIDEVCPDRVFFVEPSRAYDVGLVDLIEVPEEDRGRVVLAPHYYPIDVHEPGRAWEGSADELEASLRDLYGDALANGVPLWFGEVGGLVENPGFDGYVEALLVALGRLGAGHALWAFDEGGGFSLLDEEGAARSSFAPYRTLAPLRWPGPRGTVERQDDALTLRFPCAPGEDLVLVAAEPPAESPAVAPTDALEPFRWEGARGRARCAGDAEVEVVLRRPPGSPTVP